MEVQLVKQKFKNFIKKPVSTNNNYMTNTVKWGLDDKQPFDIIQTIRRSGTGGRCANTRSKYMFGNGFTNRDIANIDLGNGYTLEELLLDWVSQTVKLGGRAARLIHTLDGSVKAVEFIPFEELRFNEPDEQGFVHKIKRNPYWGLEQYLKADTEDYWLIGTKEDTLRRIELDGDDFNGQIFYSADTSEYSRFYPSPTWWTDNQGYGSGKSAMEAEWLFARLLEHEIGSGFLQNILLKMTGDPNEPIPEDLHRYEQGESYTTRAEELQNYLNSEMAGVDGDTMMILWSQTASEFPKLEPFPKSFSYDNLNKVHDSVVKDIARYWDIPSVLLGIQTSGAISKDDIRSAATYMQQSVRMEKIKLQSDVAKLLRVMDYDVTAEDCSIADYNPYPEKASIETHVWNELTSAEKRRWIKQNLNIELDDDTNNPTI